MPSILAARPPAPTPTAVPLPVTAGRDRVVSLVVVRDGVAETFVLSPAASEEFNVAAFTAAPREASGDSAGSARIYSLPSRGRRDLVDDCDHPGEPGELLLSEIADLLPSRSPSRSSSPPAGGLEAFNDELTSAEARVLRYLPTNLTAWEIAEELYVSLNTVKTHMRHIYAKLGAHRRREAVERARNFGLLASSSHLRPGRQAFA